MADKKPNIFVQQYQPITPATHAPPTSYPTPAGGGGLTPEGDTFSGGANEFAPIQEYVEPSIPAELQEHMQQTQQPFTLPPNIPLTPTIPQMNIQPVTMPSIPLTEEEIEKDLKVNMYNALRWLAEWCLRQIKEQHLRESSPPTEQS